MSKTFWDKSPMAIAHRGGDGAGLEEENTLKAFRAAWKNGLKYGETDVILSADGQVVAIHGSRNSLQAGLKGDISRRRLQAMTLAEIRNAVDIKGIKVATLEEILTALPRMKFLIDPKTDEVVLPLARLLKKLNALERVCVGSFSYDRVRHLMKLTKNSRVRTSFIIGRGFRLANKGVLMLKTGRLTDIEAVQLHHSLVSKEMVDLAHSRGFKALVWTANSPLAIKNALNCGADGIISDRLDLLERLSKK